MMSAVTSMLPKLTGMLVLTLTCSSLVIAEESYSRYVERSYPTNVYWGDTHLHTSLSADAYAAGTRLTPDDAYRFAKGETIVAQNGGKARLDRPLDFLVVADHDVNMGLFVGLDTDNSVLLSTEQGRALKQVWRPSDAPQKLTGLFYGAPSTVGGEVFQRSVWSGVTTRADFHNDPGKFTAFSGYEWTPLVQASFHRVIIFKDSTDRVARALPFTSLDSEDPEDLWTYLNLRVPSFRSFFRLTACLLEA